MTPKACAVALTMVATLVGCAGTTDPGGTGNSDQVQVVVAFYPFQFVAERVAGQHAQVSSLTQPGAEPHDVELTPRQAGSIATADLVIYERSFQPAVDEAVDQAGNKRALDTATVVPLAAGDDEHADEHSEEGGQAEDEGHGDEQGHAEEEDHEHGGLDPHVWLDPTNLATIATAVAGQLAEADPSHAADYTANAESLTRELAVLGGELDAGLAKCERREFITTHAAFGYLARRVGLEQIGISGLSPDAEPSPARVAEVHEAVREHGITTIFYETLVSPAVAQSIAGDLGVRTDVLDPIEGITEASRGSDYLAVMRSNLDALRTANGCS